MRGDCQISIAHFVCAFNCGETEVLWCHGLEQLPFTIRELLANKRIPCLRLSVSGNNRKCDKKKAEYHKLCSEGWGSHEILFNVFFSLRALLVVI